MNKKALLLGLLGYAGGCIIGLCFALQSREFSMINALPKILLGGIPGAVIAGSTVVYDIEEWSLLKATITHFLLTMGVILLACFLLNWFTPWSTTFWIMLAAEAAAYVIIWLIMCLRYKAEIRKLNELLKNNEKEK